MNTKFIIVFVLVLIWSSCSSIKYYTFFKTAQDDSSLLYISTPESLTYLRQTSYWSGEGVWGNLPYAILLPNMNLKRIINDREKHLENPYAFRDENVIRRDPGQIPVLLNKIQRDGMNVANGRCVHLIGYIR